MKVAAYQPPLFAAGSLDAVAVMRMQVERCEPEGVSLLCCPEAILGGLADNDEHPTRFAISADAGRLNSVLAPLASNTVTTIVGFTELGDGGLLFNSAAVFQRGSVVGLYRKLHPAINRSVYAPGRAVPVFHAGDLTFGIVICNDSNYAEPARLMAARGATALFVPTNNGLPPAKPGAELVAQSRNVDITRAVENRIWVIRADVAGRSGELVSYGSSGIVDPDGLVVQSARQLSEDLMIAEIDAGPRIHASSGHPGGRQPAQQQCHLCQTVSEVRGQQGITRRVVVGQLACLGAWAQADDDPLRQLRAAHPRLILLDSELDRLRITIRDNPLARRIYLDLEKECDRLLSAPVAEYKLVGTRLRVQCRRVLDRVSTLALMYRITLREPYQRRAVGELRAAANFRDWNPAVFLDTAEMVHAFALGYDWLYNSLSPEERVWIRDAIVTKGLDPAIPYYQHEIAWTRDRYNANVVCNAGAGIGALAVAGDPALNEKCGTILRYVLESIPHGLSTYGVEGSWPEGTMYWELVTRYASVLFAGLQTALGNDFGLSASHGVDRAGRFRIYTTSPAGKVFNFGDAGDDQGMAPEMYWLARRFSTPAFAWSEQKALEHNTHPDAYDLAWFEPNARSPQQPPAWPLDAIFRGVDVASFRSAWDDPNGLFFGVKGGNNKDAHAHLDLGSFVLSAGGVQWAADLGPDDYDLPGYLGKQRWNYYRTRTESHNTLLIDDQNQDPRAEARITRQEFAPEFTWVQIDLSRANPGKVKQWTRRAGMAQRQVFLIEDSVRSDQPVEVIWGMMTDAEITLTGQTATLRKNGWSLIAEIRTPRHAVFDIAPVHSMPPQAPNTGFRKLIVRLGDKVTELDLNIIMTPYRDGQPRPRISAQFPV